MHYRLPILALASSAVPETLADAGVLIESSDPLSVAVAANLVLRDPALLDELRQRAEERLTQLSLEYARNHLEKILYSYGLGTEKRL